MEQREKVSYDFHNFRNQFYAVFSANIIMFSQGCILGWTAPALMLLTSDKTPLDSGPITLDEMSWIGSINCLGGMFGTFTFGCFTSFMGCKRAMAFLGIPATVYWLIIMYGNSVNYIIVARFIAGWTGGGIFSISILYVAEIADDKIRGKLGSMALFSRNIGTLSAFIISSFLDYGQLPYVFIIIPTVYMINFVLLPNTPQYLIKKGEMEKAENALKFYKGCKGKTVVQSAALSKELDRMKSVANERQADKKFHLIDFYERKAMRGIVIAIVLSLLNQLSGCFTFVTYTGSILETTGTSVNPYTSTIIFGVVQIVGCLFTTHLVDKWGRKVLLIISLSGIVMGQTALSVFMYLREFDCDLSMFGWLPVTSLSFVIFMGFVGIVPLSTICTVEALPAKIRTLGMSVNTYALNISAFLLSKYFPIVSKIIGMSALLSLMSGACFLGILFVIFAMDETKGKNLDSMEREGGQSGSLPSSNNNV